MTAKTTRKKAKNRFDMPLVRRRIRKTLRRKSKKSVSLTKIDQVYKDWVKHYLIAELVKYGKVQVDKNFSLEIVGQRIVDNVQMQKLFSRGVGIRGGILTDSANLNKGRPGIFYRIVMVDKSFKDGKLKFEAHPAIKKAVHDALVNTNTHYRILL